MEKSITIQEISKALCAFHKEVGKIKKDAKNPFFKSKYASLTNIIDGIQEPLINNGLSVAQFPSGENGLTTILMHTSGEWISDCYTMKPSKSDPQGLGSAITYQRRYSICAVLCLNVDEDDDGNAASGIDKTKQPVNPKEKQKPEFPEKVKDEKKFMDIVKMLAAGTYKNTKGEDVEFTIATLEQKYNITEEIKQQLMEEVLNYE